MSISRTPTPQARHAQDPRVTPVGRFIRKTSLDELPQLFNVVFKGNLSLVGPRPHAVQAKAAERLYDEVVDGYFARHKVQPGITGWAQIHGWRGETDTQEKIQQRVEHDLYYIENWSILLDLYILFATPFALLKNRQCLLGAGAGAAPMSDQLYPYAADATHGPTLNYGGCFTASIASSSSPASSRPSARRLMIFCS